MGLIKRKIGELISLDNRKNTSGLELPFYGINKDKTFMPTIAATDGLDRKKYKIISKGTFVFSGMQTGRDMCIRIGLYDYPFDALISPAYTTFNVSSEKILPEYLFMIFKSKEMDRYGAFLSDGSIRSNLEWDVFCSIELTVPSKEVQRKYVDIYLGGQENLNALRKGVEELQRTYMSCMDSIKKSAPLLRLGDHITQLFEKNDNEKLGIDRVRGVSNTKEIQRTKANVSMRDLSTFLVIRRNQFVFNRRTTRNGERLGLGFNDTDEPLLFTNDYVAFEIHDTDVLLPEYLYLYFKRDEFDRYVRYNSWGSATEFFNWEDMQEVRVPVPDISTQKALADIYWIHKKRRELAERLEKQQKDICPILFRGAIEEGGR